MNQTIMQKLCSSVKKERRQLIVMNMIDEMTHRGWTYTDTMLECEEKE